RSLLPAGVKSAGRSGTWDSLFMLHISEPCGINTGDARRVKILYLHPRYLHRGERHPDAFVPGTGPASVLQVARLGIPGGYFRIGRRGAFAYRKKPEPERRWPSPGRRSGPKP